MSTRNNWTREDHIIAFNLYCQIPFGTIHVRNPQIQKLAKLLGRSVGSVSYKLANFARLDPTLQQRGIRGLPHGAKGEEEIWKEFTQNSEAIALESERLLARRLGKSLEEVAEVEVNDLPKEGIEREALVRIRVNQSFFRKRILSAYNYSCCITGLSIQPLLTASHILPWADDEKNRLNPRNGLCLNAIHDRAFDKGMMWIENGFVIRFSRRLYKAVSSQETVAWLTSFDGRQLLLPKNFSPDPDFLRSHAKKCADRI
jgi:putative restriction endonuclease